MTFAKIGILLVLLGAPVLASSAAVPGSLALGVRIGDLTGVDAKFYMNRYHALNASVGSISGNSIAFQGAYLWHRYNLFHSDRDDLENNLPMYFGLGGLFAGSSTTPYGTGSSLAAARGIIGISYMFANEPFDLFLELTPTVYINTVTSFLFQAGFGGRYYF